MLYIAFKGLDILSFICLWVCFTVNSGSGWVPLYLIEHINTGCSLRLGSCQNKVLIQFSGVISNQDTLLGWSTAVALDT